MSIAQNLAEVRSRIDAACMRAGRSPDDVTLIGVTKGMPAEAVAEAIEAGLADAGENRVQEAVGKIDALAARGLRPRWHLIGHLQSNKARDAVERFAIIHSVDSLRIAEAISRRARGPVPIFLEVNVAQEASKFGLSPGEVRATLPAMQALPNIDVLGLMTVAPRVDEPEGVRAVFRALRELRDAVSLRALSMGMTDDFEVAIEEGATHVRVGRAIFGERPA
jgi:pyridoxal phosphate enzyme (YggS family)